MKTSLDSSSGITGTSQFLPLKAIRNIDLKAFVRNMDWKVASGFALSAVAILSLAVLYFRSGKKVPSPQPDQKPLVKTPEVPPKPFAEITPEDLFDKEQLAETIVKEGIEANLKYICVIVLNCLRKAVEKEVKFDRTNNDYLHTFFMIGMPPGANITGEYQNQSWVIRTLIALKNKGYISEFEVVDVSEIRIQLK